MRLRYGLLFFMALMNCSRPGAIENRSTGDEKVGNTETELSVKPQRDALSYIGYIQKFVDNNSFYTDLYFIDNFDYDLYNEITKMGEGVIFKDEEVQRTKMEIERVGQYFDLTGLNSIDIYNNKNEKLTTGQLSHIEYVEDMIESKFVAVFQVRNPYIIDPLFCIGNSDNDLVKIDFSTYQDEKLKSQLMNFLHVNTDRISGTEHYKIDKQVISTISVDTTGYILETVNNSHRTLYVSKSSEVIHGLAVISRKINGREILLVQCGMPETDMMWTSVLVFNGSRYEASKNHRVGE